MLLLVFLSLTLTPFLVVDSLDLKAKMRLSFQLGEEIGGIRLNVASSNHTKKAQMPFFRAGKALKVLNSLQRNLVKPGETLVLFSEDFERQEMEEFLQESAQLLLGEPWILVSPENGTATLNLPNYTLKQRFYTLSTPSMRLIEHYALNEDISVSNVASKDMTEPNFRHARNALLQRRSNLHGIQLKAAVDQQVRAVSFELFVTHFCLGLSLLT